jgi:uncharacterized protein YecE (DUF72 family)
VYAGCSGWSYWHWRGRFYPEKLKAREFLEYYARHFNTVEVNSSFYHMPRQKTLKRWVERVPEGFKFSLKANKQITHVKRFVDSEKRIKEFYTLAEALGEKLGFILFQLPPSFKKDRIKLKAIIEHLDPEKPNAVEFRHQSWFDEEVAERLCEHNILMCSVSAPRTKKIPEKLFRCMHKSYVRFHGTERWYRHDYSREELELWIKQIKDAKLKECYVYFNNDFDANAVKNCQEFIKMCAKKRV